MAERFRRRDPAELPDNYAARMAAAAVESHEQRHHRALPNPIPPYLFPQAGPIGDADQVLTLTADELRTIAHVVATLTPDARATHSILRDGSPWVVFTVACGPPVAETFPPEDLSAYRVERFALWRYTLAVYRVGADGAVEDDPLRIGEP